LSLQFKRFRPSKGTSELIAFSLYHLAYQLTYGVAHEPKVSLEAHLFPLPHPQSPINGNEQRGGDQFPLQAHSRFAFDHLIQLSKVGGKSS